jgi:hypothetical protein
MWNRFLLWEKGILEGGKGDIMIPNISMKEQQIIIFSIMKMQRCLKVMISLFCGTYGYRSWNISSKQRSIEVFYESTWGNWFRDGRIIRKPSSQPRK